MNNSSINVEQLTDDELKVVVSKLLEYLQLELIVTSQGFWGKDFEIRSLKNKSSDI